MTPAGGPHIGSLLYIDLLSTSPFVFGLQARPQEQQQQGTSSDKKTHLVYAPQALSLGSRTTSLLKDLGPAESFFDQV